MLPLEPTPYSKDYEITDAMFGAFRSPGGMPFFWKLFGWLTLAYTILYAVFLPIVFKSYFSFLKVAVESGNTPTPAQTQALFANMFMMFPAILLMSFIGLAIMAVSRAAFFRGYFFGETDGIFPYRFGGDELRQGLAILGYWGVYLLAYLAPYILFIVVIAVLVAVIGESAAIFAAILIFFAVIAWMVFLVWVMVKLAPAGALTALRGRTHVLAARHVSQNRFWALFGSLLVAGLIGYVVAYILFILGFAVGLAGLFDSRFMDALIAEDFELIVENVTALMSSPGFKVGVFFAILLSSAGSAFYSLLIAGPTAYFTRQWAESGAAHYNASDDG